MIFPTALIGAEGTKTPRKCYRIFFVRGQIQGSKSISCGRTGLRRPHRRFCAEEALLDRPKVREVPRDRQKPPVPAVIIRRSFP